MAKNKAELENILKKYSGVITGLSDLTAGEAPSGLFYILANKLDYLLDNDPEKAILTKDIMRCRKLNPILKLIGVHFLSNPQIFENRNFLKNPCLEDVPTDTEIVRASISKAVRTMKLGTDLIVFPEGIWNKSPNALSLDLWSGIYRIACETGAKVVPIVHYIYDSSNKGKNNPVHTVLDDPIRIDDLSERAALEYLRDVFATWFYLMIEAYGKTTREELVDGAICANEVWERYLANGAKTVARYDTEIELCADYRPKEKVLPQNVWREVANITELTKDNAFYVSYARKLVEQLDKEDFQRRF